VYRRSPFFPFHAEYVYAPTGDEFTRLVGRGRSGRLLKLAYTPTGRNVWREAEKADREHVTITTPVVPPEGLEAYWNWRTPE
jgi:hypothetical protein